MYNPNLSLKDLFIQDSLRNMKTERNNPMPHRGNTYYITFQSYCENKLPELREILEKWNSWNHSRGFSVSSYIDLSKKGGDLVSSRLIMLGPNSNSSSFRIEVIENDNDIRMTASGWGSSSILLYSGDKKAFLDYLLIYQKRS